MRLAKKNPKLYTPEEYLEFEWNSDIHHKYRNSEIYQLVGGIYKRSRLEL